MRRLVEIVAAALPLDERGRRAMNETLLDWDHEASLTPLFAGQLWCGVRALVSVAHTLAAISRRELTAVPRSGVLLRISFWLIGSFVVFQLPTAISRLPSEVSPALPLLLFASWAAFFMPVALLLATSHPARNARRQPPLLGLAVAVPLVMVIAVGWLLPSANQHFRQTFFEARGGVGQLSRSIAELTLPELISGTDHRHLWSREAELRYASTLFALVAACPAVLLLAGQFRMLNRRVRLVALFALSVCYPFAARIPGIADNRVAGFWLVPAVFVLATAWLALWRDAHATAGLKPGGYDC